MRWLVVFGVLLLAILLWATREDAPPRGQRSAATPDQKPARPKDPEPGVTREEAPVESRRLGALGGTVIGDDGKPITGIDVVLHDGRTCKTDAKGRFRFDDVARGEPYVRAGKAWDYVELAEGEVKLDVVLDFRERGSVIRLRVLDPAGQTVRDATVAIKNVCSAVTGLNGRAHLEIGQPWGNRFKVSVTPHERDRRRMAGRSFIVKSTSGAERVETDVRLRMPKAVRIIVVPADAKVTTDPIAGFRPPDTYFLDPKIDYDIEARKEGYATERLIWEAGDRDTWTLKLERPGAIVGRAVGPDRKPVRYPQVYVSTGKATSKRDGTFRVENAGLGERTLVLVTDDLAARANLIVTSETAFDLGDVKMGPKLEVTRRIVDQAGRPIPGVLVMARPRAVGRATSTDADGRFTIKVARFAYLLLREEGYATRAVRLPPLPRDIVMPRPGFVRAVVHPPVLGNYWYVAYQVFGEKRFEITQMGSGPMMEFKGLPPGRVEIAVHYENNSRWAKAKVRAGEWTRVSFSFR